MQISKSTTLLLFLAFNGHNAIVNADTCSTNKQCQDELDDTGACCLYLEQKDDHRGSYDCANENKKTYYLQSRDYNKHLRQWVNPKDPKEHYQVFCHDERVNQYNYVQPYAEPHVLESPQKDLFNENVYSDMFFKPKQVTNFWEQMEKWWNVYFWGWMGVGSYVLAWNLGMFFIDSVSINDPELIGTYPTMYNNFMTQWIMSTEWALQWFWPGVFKYYDMFSVQGWLDFQWDFLSISFSFAPIQLIGRMIIGDWYWLAPENDNTINMNALFPKEHPQGPDPFDFTIHLNREGPDCNGNIDMGNYCYCADQGFSCQCKYNKDFSEGETIKTCYDYFGYDCAGNYVDGEAYWCTEEGNTFTFLNEMKKNGE